LAGVIMHYPDHIRIMIIMVGDQAKKLTAAPTTWSG
jgi:hypothetical protein